MSNENNENLVREFLALIGTDPQSQIADNYVNATNDVSELIVNWYSSGNHSRGAELLLSADFSFVSITSYIQLILAGAALDSSAVPAVNVDIIRLLGFLYQTGYQRGYDTAVESGGSAFEDFLND